MPWFTLRGLLPDSGMGDVAWDEVSGGGSGLARPCLYQSIEIISMSVFLPSGRPRGLSDSGMGDVAWDEVRGGVRGAQPRLY